MTSESNSGPERASQIRLGTPLLVASPDAVLQLVATRYVRSPLEPAEIRDLRLLVFLLEVDSGRFSDSQRLEAPGLAYTDESAGAIAARGGISRERVSAATTRLVEAGALLVEDGVDPRLIFADRALRPIGTLEYVDWPSALPRLHGQAPGLLVLQAVLELMRLPWEWVSLPYETLAERAYYSLGMVRHGMGQLLTAGVLERSSHSGRSHEYRCSSVVLRGGPRYAVPVLPPGGDLAPGTDEPPTRSRKSSVVPPNSTGGTAKSGGTNPASTASSHGAMVVEIGGLVLRLPEGTVISMGLDATGAAVYEVGPHIRIRSDGSES